MDELASDTGRDGAATIPYEARRRLFEKGPEALSDSELLALIFGPCRETACSRPALDQANRLIEGIGGVRQLARATFSELLQKKEMDPHDAASVVAAFELGRRAVGTRVDNGGIFRTSAEVFEHFRGRLCNLQKEVFYAVLLDAKHRKLREVQISEGSLTSSIVHPREVFAPAVRESAAAIILIHNHPSSDPTPSPEDVEITRRLRQAGELLGIRVLDHVIAGGGSHFSFVDAGHW